MVVGETMREAMDHVRTDTDDLTGATLPVPTDEELTTAVALLAAHRAPTSPRRPPGWWVIGALAVFILLADVGILVAFSAQSRQARAVCRSQNEVRATVAATLVSQEASVPAERYDAATRTFYDRALGGLAPVDCSAPVRRQVAVPKRMPRELGQPPAVAVPGSGATGETGAAGVAGLVGADGKDGKDGAAGKDGESVVGPRGAPGDPGITGAVGAPGLPGADSQVPGPPGPAGPPGMDATTTTTTTTPPPPPLCLIPPCP